MKKRAKRTETINYRREIWNKIAENPRITKDRVCHMIKGNRQVVFNDINNMIVEEILLYNKAKNELKISTTDDLERRRIVLVEQVAIFTETRKNTFREIRKRIKNSPEKTFFTQQRIKVAIPTIERNLPKKTSKIYREMIKEPEYREDEIWSINSHAKDYIFMLPTLIDNLVRCSFSLYTSHMLQPVSNETWKIFEGYIRTAVVAINETKKELLDLVLEFSKNKKASKKFFERWWSEITYGLSLEFENVVPQGKWGDETPI